jgi:hypothetical protein
MHWIAAIITIAFVVAIGECVLSSSRAIARAEDHHNEQDAW